MEEVWVKLEAQNGMPELLVSNTGRIKRASSGHIYKPSIVKGYEVLSIGNNGKHYNTKVHRLVATAFLPNPDKLPEVNHKNGVKNDNRVTNLEWCTRSQNAKHAYANGLNYPSGGLPPRPIVCVELNKEFPSIWAAARYLGKTDRSRIRKSAYDSKYTAYGYHWKFIEMGVIM